MTTSELDAFIGKVWQIAGQAGIEGGTQARNGYQPMLVALAEAGAAPEVAAAFLERQVQVTMAQYLTLIDAVEVVSDGMASVVAMSEGRETDPVSVGYSLVKQKAGLTALQDACARLAPFADVDNAWDPSETGPERDAAAAERDGFLSAITAAADEALGQ